VITDADIEALREAVAALAGFRRGTLAERVRMVVEKLEDEQ
jgi:hypothetical protein